MAAVGGVPLALFLAQARQAGHGRAYLALTTVVLDDATVLQPDLLFIAKGRLHIVTEQNIHGPPDLIIEVLSETTRKRDLGAKLRLYARFGVPHYWVVDPDERTVRVFTRTDDRYTAQEPPLASGAELTCPLFPGIATPVAELFNT